VHVDVEDVHEVVARCPTGALSVEARSEAGRREEVAAPNRLVVASNGPLYVSGDLDIDGAGDDQPSLGVRAALCRCGASKNKPFCDGAHDEVGFRDAGAVGESSSVDEPESGPLEIKRIKGGPLLATGPFSIVSGSGRDAWQGERAALCRCGASKNKPFCDGSHSKIEFDAD